VLHEIALGFSFFVFYSLLSFLASDDLDILFYESENLSSDRDVPHKNFRLDLYEGLFGSTYIKSSFL
jgi:hypothetical protein